LGELFGGDLEASPQTSGKPTTGLGSSRGLLPGVALIETGVVAEGSESAGSEPNGLDFLARGDVGRAKLLLSRIPAARTAAIPAASQNRWQSLTARTSVRWLGRSLALGW